MTMTEQDRIATLLAELPRHSWRWRLRRGIGRRLASTPLWFVGYVVDVDRDRHSDDG